MGRGRLLASAALLAAPAFAQDERRLAVLGAKAVSMMTSQFALERGESDPVRVLAEQEAVARCFGAECDVPFGRNRAGIVAQVRGPEGARVGTPHLWTRIAAHEEGRPIFEQHSEGGEMEMGRGATMGVSASDPHLVMLRSFREPMGA